MKMVEKIRELLIKHNYSPTTELLLCISTSVNNSDTERNGINNYMRSHLTDLVSNANMIMYLLENEEDDDMYLSHIEKYIIPIYLKDDHGRRI